VVTDGDDRFEEFLASVEPRLRTAFVSMYGPVDGRAVTVDALSWAWEHWGEVATMHNPVGYLFRVGQSAARHYHRGSHAVPVGPEGSVDAERDVDLTDALATLSVQQRTAVLLVHGFGWTHRDVAELLDVTASTVGVHLERGVRRLRELLATGDGDTRARADSAEERSEQRDGP
jgi:DNA-directed RNA polymerase specialized sigma24 family protein